jgi:3-carboxy-cis,cis-muconate cycloisomerase
MTFSTLDSALHGPLFAPDSMRAVFSDRARLAAMLRVEAALADAEAALGLVPDTVAPAIAALSPDDFDLEALGQATALSGVLVIPFLKALQAKLPREIERFVHKGATTQDITDSAQMLMLQQALDLIARDLVATIDALAGLAEQHAMTPCVGRTYGQHAVPLSFGFKVAGWLMGIAEVAARLPDLRRRCLVASLSGPVGTLSGLGDKGEAVLARFAAALGLATPVMSWHTRRAAPVEIGTWLAMLAGALGKMAGDIAHLVSTEVGEVSEPYVAGRGGSSAMPHKRNPVSSTIILAAAQNSAALSSSLLAGMVAAHERPAGAWHAEWTVLPELCGLVAGALAEARRLAEGLEVHPERMARNLDLTQGLIYADAVAAALTPTLGRGPAHYLVEAAVTLVRERGIGLREAVLTHPERPAALDEAALDRAFDPAPAVSAAAQWVTPAIAEARQISSTLL